ncbi:MAG TPA: MarR family transcriptional regulator [Longimicrobiales bacterium]
MRKPEVAARLHSAAIHLLRRVRRDDPLMELTPARASVLSVLVFGGPRSPGELAAIEQVAAPTMTKLVNGLARDGYVRKRSHPGDGRAVVITATAKAKRALQAGRRRRIRLLQALFEDLSDGEWEVLDQAAGIIERGAVGAQR